MFKGKTKVSNFLFAVGSYVPFSMHQTVQTILNQILSIVDRMTSIDSNTILYIISLPIRKSGIIGFSVPPVNTQVQ